MIDLLPTHGTLLLVDDAKSEEIHSQNFYKVRLNNKIYPRNDLQSIQKISELLQTLSFDFISK